MSIQVSSAQSQPLHPKPSLPPTCLVHRLSSEAMMLTVRSSSSPAALSSFFFTCRRIRYREGQDFVWQLSRGRCLATLSPQIDPPLHPQLLLTYGAPTTPHCQLTLPPKRSLSLPLKIGNHS